MNAWTNCKQLRLSRSSLTASILAFLFAIQVLGATLHQHGYVFGPVSAGLNSWNDSPWIGKSSGSSISSEANGECGHRSVISGPLPVHLESSCQICAAIHQIQSASLLSALPPASPIPAAANPEYLFGRLWHPKYQLTVSSPRAPPIL